MAVRVSPAGMDVIIPQADTGTDKKTNHSDEFKNQSFQGDCASKIKH